ncbi:YgiW/YdeI family stress tolerance OB fold protein [Citrobacter freundii]|uniref:YgiW/YdeI family stress tolerance OB fold protein n=1 Tax=Citrobacter freundii TaxID=546 RepID=UPI001EEFB038|nr:YgiW/YdeI family stress tolerance OB fold protein [Citrobacter freundii]
MKKIAAVATILAIVSAPVFAASAEGGFSDPVSTSPVSQVQARTGGFNDVNALVSRVSDIDKMNDGAWVKLRGNIVERLSGDHYLFRDASGTIDVEIDHKYWNGVTASPQDKVEIQGKIDKEWNQVNVDVKQISKIS